MPTTKSDKPKQSKSKRDNRTVAQKRRAEYQESQRQHLRGKGLVNAICKDIEAKHSDADLPLVKWRNDTRLKLLNKILPDLKQTEVTNAEGETFKTEARGPLVEAAAALALKLRG